MELTRNMKAALKALDRRLGTTWERRQLARAKNRPVYEVRLDRLGITASGWSADAILDISGYRRTGDTFIKRKDPQDFLPYSRRCVLESDGSVEELTVLYEPPVRTVAACKFILRAKDSTGLLRKDVLAILELLPDVRLVLVEIAWDFGFSSGVDGAYVRAHALFGKSRRNKVATRRCWDSWGSRRGAKYIRSYYKKELGVHRVELQLNRRYLRRHNIADIFDFQRLVDILPRHQLFFARLDEGRTLRQLRNAGHGTRETNRILEMVRLLDGDLLARLSILRKRGGLKNVRRALVPLKKNELVHDALREWARHWPKTPMRIVREGGRKA